MIRTTPLAMDKQPTHLTRPTRRSFMSVASVAAGYLAMVGAGASSLLTSGCNVIADIENWVPVGLNALASILTLLGPLVSPAASAIVIVIKTAFSDLLTATQQYQNDTNPADKATTLARIQTYLNDLTSGFQNLLNSVPNGTIVNLAIGLTQIVLTTIAGFLAQIPASQTGGIKLKLPAKVTVRGVEIAIPPTPRSNRRFKHDWNSLAKSNGHPEIEFHVSLLEHL